MGRAVIFLQTFGILCNNLLFTEKLGGHFTRCLSKLYKDPHWSHKDLQDAISVARKLVTSSKVGAFSAERLVYYFQQLILLEKEGRKVTLTDLWGLIIEYFLQQKVIRVLNVNGLSSE